MMQVEVAYLTQQETSRSNKAQETENRRANMAREAETYRSNLARENETNRANLAREAETNRANLVNEHLGFLNYSEIARANRAREQENYRHNVETELNATNRLNFDIGRQKQEYDIQSRKLSQDRYKLDQKDIELELASKEQQRKTYDMIWKNVNSSAKTAADIFSTAGNLAALFL